MSITPECESDGTHYCRLFRRWPNRPTLGTPEYHKFVTGLQELVDNMLDDGSRLCKHKPEEPMDAGYTYFGQFIDHDLTNDPTKVDDAWKLQPDEIQNRQTPQLDLGHLYGSGPEHRRDGILYDGNQLKVGAKVESIIEQEADHSFDVGFENGKLLLADDRARENVIIREITAVFARLHNLAVDQFGSFDRARQQTVWQFQRLVVEDYLYQVLDPAVYKSVFANDQPMIEWTHFSIPVEFSVAAFRFGHSMVRNSYFLSDETKDRTLLELLERGLKQVPLEAEWEIDWGKFFQNASDSPVITARPIDTRIASGLYHVPLPTLLLFNAGASKLFVQNDAIRLPFVSLMRGSGLALASGQYVARRFGEPALTEDELTADCDGKTTSQGEVLKVYGLTDETPLFYYILKESEVRNNGNRLGPTGSHIVAETIYAALKHDSSSYLSDPAGAVPPVWDFPTGKRTIETLRDLFQLADEL